MARRALGSQNSETPWLPFAVIAMKLLLENCVMASRSNNFSLPQTSLHYLHTILKVFSLLTSGTGKAVFF